MNMDGQFYKMKDKSINFWGLQTLIICVERGRTLLLPSHLRSLCLTLNPVVTVFHLINPIYQEELVVLQMGLFQHLVFALDALR